MRTRGHLDDGTLDSAPCCQHLSYRKPSDLEIKLDRNSASSGPSQLRHKGPHAVANFDDTPRLQNSEALAKDVPTGAQLGRKLALRWELHSPLEAP